MVDSGAENTNATSVAGGDYVTIPLLLFELGYRIAIGNRCEEANAAQHSRNDRAHFLLKYSWSVDQARSEPEL